MASERAKALAAKQKAEKKAAKLAKKNSTDPRDWPWYRQIWETYKRTKEVDPKLDLWLGGAFLLGVVVFVVVGILLKSWLAWSLLGGLTGVTLALWVLVRRAKRGTFARYKGQAGSAEIALGMLPKGWQSTPAIAANKNLDVVHRALGPGGLILIGEGEPGRLKALLAGEMKKHDQVAYFVTSQAVIMGDKDGQVPLEKLADHIRKLPKVLNKGQIADVAGRLKALDSVRGRMPIPKGPMPSMKGSKRAMRGK